MVHGGCLLHSRQPGPLVSPTGHLSQPGAIATSTIAGHPTFVFKREASLYKLAFWPLRPPRLGTIRHRQCLIKHRYADWLITVRARGERKSTGKVRLNASENSEIAPSSPRAEFRGQPMMGSFPARKQIQSGQPRDHGGYDRFLSPRQVGVLPAEVHALPVASVVNSDAQLRSACSAKPRSRRILLPQLSSLDDGSAQQSPSVSSTVPRTISPK